MNAYEAEKGRKYIFSPKSLSAFPYNICSPPLGRKAVYLLDEAKRPTIFGLRTIAQSVSTISFCDGEKSSQKSLRFHLGSCPRCLPNIMTAYGNCVLVVVLNILSHTFYFIKYVQNNALMVSGSNYFHSKLNTCIYLNIGTGQYSCSYRLLSNYYG